MDDTLSKIEAPPGKMLIEPIVDYSRVYGKVATVAKGRIVAYGNDPRFNSNYTLGDIAWYGKYSGIEILLDGKLYHVVRTGDVFGTSTTTKG